MFLRAAQIQARRIPVLFGDFVGDGVERVPALFGPRRAVSFGPSFRLRSLFTPLRWRIWFDEIKARGRVTRSLVLHNILCLITQYHTICGHEPGCFP
jgi:hypothetical protein